MRVLKTCAFIQLRSLIFQNYEHFSHGLILQKKLANITERLYILAKP